MVMEVAAAAAAREDSLRANSGLKDFVFIYKTVDVVGYSVLALSIVEFYGIELL